LIGIDQISKKLDNLILYSNKYTGKKRKLIESNISSLKNDLLNDSMEIENIQEWSIQIVNLGNQNIIIFKEYIYANLKI